MQTVFFQDLPMSSAQFTGVDHGEVVCVGRRPFYYVYDVHSGIAAGRGR